MIRKLFVYRISSLSFIGKFGAVGLLGTLAFFLLLWIFVEIASMPVMFATSTAFILVVLQNYILHHQWTFHSTKQHKTALPQFFIMSLTGFFINGLVMYYGVLAFSINYLIVQSAAILAVILWNFMLSTLWVFSEN